jgi:RNA polymerase sigma-70 factor (ECF subfamily)
LDVVTRPLPIRSARAAVDAADDATLARAAGAGDRRAFADLYRRHLNSVYARLTRVVGPAPERDDLVQQIFLDLYRALPRFRGDAALTTFLYRIVLNVACEHLERRRRGRARNEPLDDRQLETLIAPGASPEQQARQRQELRRLFEHLEELSPKRRAAFVLVAVEGLPLEDAAALLNANPPAIKQRVLEARRQLSNAMDRDAPEGRR